MKSQSLQKTTQSTHGIEIQLPDTGSWRYLKRDSQGRLTYGIYALSVLGESCLAACQAQYPDFQFRLVALPPHALEPGT